MKKVIRLSRLLKWCALLVCVALPLIEAGYWITSGYSFLQSYFAIESVYPIKIEWSTLKDIQKFLGFLISLMPLIFSMMALFYLSRLFRAFEKLEFFDHKNTKILKKAGLSLVWGQIVFPFHTAFLSLALSYQNPIGKRNISISLGSDQFEILAIGLSILLASWVFGEAVKLQEDQQATV